MKALHSTAILLVVVGGLNWLLVGLFDFDLVATIFGDMSVASRVIYVLVGLAAIYTLVAAPRFIKGDQVTHARA